MNKKITFATLLIILTTFSSQLVAPPTTTHRPAAYVEPTLLAASAETVSVIVTGRDANQAAAAVEQVGGHISSSLWLIDAVAATVPASGLDKLAANLGVISVVENKGVDTADEWDGWVTRRKIKKGSHLLGDSFSGASVALPDGGLFLISENGQILIVNADGSERARVSVTSGAPFITPPVVAPNGTVFLAGESHRIYAFDPDGSQLWTTRKGNAKYIGGIAVGPDGTVYVANEKRRLYAFDGETGARLWTFKAPAGDSVVAAPTIGSNGTIYLATEGGYLYALDPDRTTRWSFSAGDGRPFLRSAFLDGNGRVYLAGEDKRVYALDADNGSLVYQFTTGSKIKAQPAVGPDGSLFVAAEEQTLYGLNPDGSLRFEFSPAAGSFETSPVLSPDGSRVFVASREGRLYAIDAEIGNLVWQYLAHGEVLAAPAVDEQNYVHLGDAQGDYVMLTPDGVELSEFDQHLAIEYSPVVAQEGNVYVSSGQDQVSLVGRLPDHWDGRPDVIPTDDKKVYQLVNPVAVDLGVDIVHDTELPDGKKITGDGVTVAILDTGIYFDKEVKKQLGPQVEHLYLGQADFVEATCATYQQNKKKSYTIGTQFVDHCFLTADDSADVHGHGTHVAGTIWNQFKDFGTGITMGIAPEAKILSVRVLDGLGNGTYEGVIQGVQYIVANQENFNIRVLNLSLSAQATTPYFIDPLNRAVEAAWSAGIVVLAAAGNNGPGTQTISVPGNDPYVITVGAVNGNRTPGYWADDLLAGWSATGPTLDGFLKPDLLAPGSQIVSFMYNDPQDVENSAYLVQQHPDYSETASLFRMNGTSMATGITSGVVALILQADPALTPDQVKFRLLYTSKQLVTDQGDLVYNLFQQGAGRIWAPEAVLGTVPVEGNGNSGMDIRSDLAHGWGYLDDQGNPVLDEAELAYHYSGPVKKAPSEDGTINLYYIENGDGTAVALGASDAASSEWLSSADIDQRVTFNTSGNMVWAGGNMVWAGGNMVWAGGKLFDAAGNMVWAGGELHVVDGQLLDAAGNMVWAGGELFDAAGNMVWAGGNMVWAGGNMVWAGGNMVWAGGQLFDAAGNMVWAGGALILTGGHLFDSMGNMVWSNGDLFDTAGNMVWAGGNMVWAGGNMVWAGGNMVWAGGNMVWAGGNMVWAGGNMVWAGGNMVWAGGNMVWAGGNMVWAGGNMVWAGGNMVWAGDFDWALGVDTTAAAISPTTWIEDPAD